MGISFSKWVRHFLFSAYSPKMELSPELMIAESLDLKTSVVSFDLSLLGRTMQISEACEELGTRFCHREWSNKVLIGRHHSPTSSCTLLRKMRSHSLLISSNTNLSRMLLWEFCRCL